MGEGNAYQVFYEGGSVLWTPAMFYDHTGDIFKNHPEKIIMKRPPDLKITS